MKVFDFGANLPSFGPSLPPLPMCVCGREAWFWQSLNQFFCSEECRDAHEVERALSGESAGWDLFKDIAGAIASDIEDSFMELAKMKTTHLPTLADLNRILVMPNEVESLLIKPATSVLHEPTPREVAEVLGHLVVPPTDEEVEEHG